MSATTKKPLIGSSESRTLLRDSSVASPFRSPIRSTPLASATSAGNIVTRSNSIRTSAPAPSRTNISRQDDEVKENSSQAVNGDDEPRMNRRSNNTTPTLENGLNRSDSLNNSKLLLQKDRLIESLRMELAESQIKIVESENMGGGRLQALEKQLLEARMKNAKLMEENESYQVLLSEKTMSGDFSKSDIMGSTKHNTDALNALEGRSELPSQTKEDGGAQNDQSQDLETELKSCKDQNKALILYINMIIERLLNHPDFEAILDQSSELRPVLNLLNKDIPAIPKQSNGVSVLKRAKTVAMGATRQPRPQSFMPSSSHSLVTDLETAPSIPFSLHRTNNHRTNRPHSEQFTGGASITMSQMLRNGHTSPPIHGPHSPRQTSGVFTSTTPVGSQNTVQRNPSFSQPSISGNFPGIISECSSTSSDNGEANTPSTNSPPRAEKATTFAGNKPRPLRLLQETGPSEAARKAEEAAAKLKRSSWMGWAFGKKEEYHVENIAKD